MQANTGNRASPQSWKSLYEAAILELDGKKLPERIAEAEHAVIARMESVSRSSDGDGEAEALMNALNVLHDLKHGRR